MIGVSGSYDPNRTFCRNIANLGREVESGIGREGAEVMPSANATTAGEKSP